MRMTRAQWDELIAHAREEAPNECCGYARAKGGVVDEGWEVATYHSHPRSAAEPSQTDINLATYPNWTYLIVSLDGDPHVRAWRIVDGKVDEQPIEVDG